MSTQEHQEPPQAGKTAKAFEEVAYRYVDSCVKATILPDLKDKFISTLPECTEAIEECYEQGEAYMNKYMKKGIRQIMDDSQLVDKENRLDQVIAEAEQRERVRTHLVPTPKQVSMGIIYKAKKMELIRLQKILDDVTEENYKLMNSFRKGIKEEGEKEAHMNSLIDRFTKTIDYSASIPSEDLIDIMDELDLQKDD